MDVEARLNLIRQVGEEIVTEDELRALLAEKPHPIAYDGFEPSGTIHIAQGLLRAINVNKMTKAGVRFKMFVADWHAWANNKMGGDLEKIQTTGKYIVETWKATGMDLEHVDFVWASEFMADETYWKKVMNIARDSSLDRVLRTTQIMGRSDKDKLSAAQILYPCMQAADIFHLKADITQLGMDQRKVNMLAREVGPKLGFWKPVVVSHHMLAGLQQPPAKYNLKARLRSIPQAFMTVSLTSPHVGTPQGDTPAFLALRSFAEQIERCEILDDARIVLSEFDEVIQAGTAPYWNKDPNADPRFAQSWQALRDAFPSAAAEIEKIKREQESAVVERANAMKMSKSNADSAIFMTDTVIQVENKLKKAYCPEKVVEENPVLEYARYIVFERFPSVAIERPDKFGGNVTFHSYAELEAAFREGKLHPGDLKKAVAVHVNKLLDPVREHFEKNEKARALKQQVEAFKVTR